MLNINELMQEIGATRARSYWDKAVKTYALELVEELNKSIKAGRANIESIKSVDDLEAVLKSGAPCWNAYSDWGLGCSLESAQEIARRVCTPSELKRYKGGEIFPNECQTWQEIQGTALFCAWNDIIKKIVKL